MKITKGYELSPFSNLCTKQSEASYVPASYLFNSFTASNILKSK